MTAEAPKPLERDIEKYICDVLALDGWRVLKMEQNYSERKRKVVGESGMPDRLFIRYTEPDANDPLDLDVASYVAACAEVMWIEAKRPGGKAKSHQKLWHVSERARGALTMIAGVDFPATCEGFLAWYRSSGLMRRELR